MQFGLAQLVPVNWAKFFKNRNARSYELRRGRLERKENAEKIRAHRKKKTKKEKAMELPECKYAKNGDPFPIR